VVEPVVAPRRLGQPGVHLATSEIGVLQVLCRNDTEVTQMAERRPMGSLEASVLDQLWHSTDPLTPADVQADLDTDLAYTTVMTILTRLWKKGLVTRSRSGRAYAYSPAATQAEFLAERMQGELGRTKDRPAVLSQFVDKLSKKDAAALRDLLGEMDT
jgi:predicted transcriptional regulator